MHKIGTALCLALSLAISPFAFAHDTPLPHHHGYDVSWMMVGALVILVALATTIVWSTLKRDDE